MPNRSEIELLTPPQNVITYSSASDVLRIQLSSGPYDKSEEVLEGLVIDYDPGGKIMAIEIDSASTRATLDQVLDDPSVLLDESGPALQIFTIRELSTKLRISARTLQKTIQRMRDEGLAIGLNNSGATTTTILTESDAERIRDWRKRHRPGRPPL